MKSAVAIWLITAAIVSALIGAPRELRYCYVDATNVSKNDEVRSHLESVWGDYVREQFHGMVLKIRVGTTENTDGRVTLN